MHVSAKVCHSPGSSGSSSTQIYVHSPPMQGSGDGEGVDDQDDDDEDDGVDDADGVDEGEEEHSNRFTQRIGSPLKLSPHCPNTMIWL